MILNDNLNASQKAAIVHVEGPLRIIAGPGSGKTKVLTNKVAYLIDKVGYDPKKILAVTFTNKAANEMKERIRNLIGSKIKETNIQTYHALALKILREDIAALNYSPHFRILDEIDQKQILKRIYTKNDLSHHTLTYKKGLRFISKIKINEDDIDSLLKSDTSEDMKAKVIIFKEYDKELKKRKSLDFDDLLLFVNKLFKNFEKIKEKWAKKFDYVLVDEFQDTSLIQYNITKDLVSSHQNICVVGDIDQTIYTWRGADVELFLDFNKDFPNTTTITLDENYRSSKNIVHSANSLIKHNKKRIDKVLFTQNKIGSNIEFYHGFNSSYECRWIVSKIKELRKNKCQLKDIAIFYRSNYLSKNIEQALITEGIEYKIFGGVKFFERSEIKDVLSFLSVIENNDDDTSFLRIINVPSRKIGQNSINKIMKKSKEKGISIYKTIINHIFEIPLSETKKKSLIELVNKIYRAKVVLKKFSITKVIEQFLYDIKYLQSFNEKEEDDRVNNIRELIKSVSKFEKEEKSPSIANYLQKIALFFSHNDNQRVIDYVSLMTVHTAKGLEFKNVFLSNFCEGVFPTYQAISSGSSDMMEEERRLAYVAITRAKENLFISDSKGILINQEFRKKPSHFLREMDIDKTISEATQTINIFDSENNENNNYGFVIGDKIKHIKFGFGQVVAVYTKIIDVSFPDPHGVKSLMKNHKSIERG